MTCQCRDFPTELRCNTIIYLLFHRLDSKLIILKYSRISLNILELINYQKAEKYIGQIEQHVCLTNLNLMVPHATGAHANHAWTAFNFR